jgi:hypothetical protein
MTTPHPDKALIDAITSGVPVQHRAMDITALVWVDCSMNRALEVGATDGWQNVRIKPADTHREKTVRYPVPMQVMPKYGDEYCRVMPIEMCIVVWFDAKYDHASFNAGLCYEIHREAEAREAWQARFGEGWK